MEIKNTYITYSKLLSLIYPFFEMNWWEDFMSWWELNMMINLSIQDVINNASFSFMAEFEYIKENELYEDTYNIFKTKHPINKIHELLLDWEWEDMSWNIVNTMPALSSNDIFFRKGTNIVYCNKNISKIVINYEKDFEPLELLETSNADKLLPIPFSYVPSLIKMIYDYAAPFNFYQWDSTAWDFYGHAKTRLNDLVAMDQLSTNHSVSIWNNF